MKPQTILLAALCALTLSACACPRGPAYEGEPYSAEKTAGPGYVENGCLHRTIF